MRTNKERVEEVFRRAEAYNETAEKEPTRVKPWVKWVACTLSVVIVIGAMVGLVVGLIQHFYFNLDQMYIANFSKYKAIGAGGADTTAEDILQANSTGIRTYSTNSEDLYFVGVDNENNIERILISKNKDGKANLQQVSRKIKNFASSKNFTFIDFGDYRAAPSEFFCESSYVIDNKTGKFYSLNKFGKYARCMISRNDDGIIYDNYCEVENSIYINIEYSDNPAIYKMYIEDEKLVLKEIIKFDLDPGSNSSSYDKFNLDVNNYFVDKFDNLYLFNDSQRYGVDSAQQTYIRYVLTTDGQIKKLNTNLYKSLNGICYTPDNSMYVDENGELQDNVNKELPKIFLPNYHKVKTVGNVDYYFMGNLYDCYYGVHDNVIYKITWEDEIKFSLEEITVPEIITVQNYVTTKDYIYVIASSVISKIDIESGKITPLNTEYVITSIETDNLGNVLFYGYKNVGEKIIGIITNDFTSDEDITILTEPQKYRIFYITAVN